MPPLSPSCRVWRQQESRAPPGSASVPPQPPARPLPGEQTRGGGLRGLQKGKLRLGAGGGGSELLSLAADRLRESSQVTGAAAAGRRQPCLGFWSGPLPSRRAARGGGRGASLIHELLAEAQSRGKMDDLLQVVVGGFIKLSAASRKSDEYSRFRPGSRSPALATTGWMRHRKAGAVASEAPGSPELLLLPGKLRQRQRHSARDWPPKPTCGPRFKDIFIWAQFPCSNT